MLWVLKKKYLDGKFERCKGRICYDGRMQKDKFEKATGSVLDTFAPTARHTTQKLVCARSVSEGSNRTRLSSRAYIEKLVSELPRPLESYPKYSTPCSAGLMASYEEALANRASVDPVLRASYPVKVGKLIYAMPASRLRHLLFI